MSGGQQMEQRYYSSLKFRTTTYRVYKNVILVDVYYSLEEQYFYFVIYFLTRELPVLTVAGENAFQTMVSQILVAIKRDIPLPNPYPF